MILTKKRAVFGLLTSLGFLTLIVAARTSGAVQIEFDYSYDTNGFFTPERRELMEMAAAHVNRYVDTLEPIVPTEENTWFTFPPLPPAGADTFLENMEIPADTLRVIVGGNSILPGLTLSLTNPPPAGFLTGSPEWADLLASRGQVGALATPPTDYGNWGAVTMFNSDPRDVTWHFGKTTEGLDPDETDFLTTAMHELMHVFGFGPAESFQAQTNLNPLAFEGHAAREVSSPNNPQLELNDGGHWTEGTLSAVGGRLQEALMGPVIAPGERRFPTLLDRAALRDVGWQEAAPGDVNLDRQFDTRDIVIVSQSDKYLTGDVASWADGDWNDDLRFDQKDIVLSLRRGLYLTGPYAAVAENGALGDGQTSVIYNANTGEIAVDPSEGTELTSINIDSTAGIFTGDAAQNLGGSFDNDDDGNIFKATFGGSFGSLSFGNVAQPGLSEQFVLGDLTVIGSLAGGGDLGEVDLVYIPEPASLLLLGIGLFGLLCLVRLSCWNRPVGAGCVSRLRRPSKSNASLILDSASARHTMARSEKFATWKKPGFSKKPGFWVRRALQYFWNGP